MNTQKEILSFSEYIKYIEENYSRNSLFRGLKDKSFALSDEDFGRIVQKEGRANRRMSGEREKALIADKAALGTAYDPKGGSVDLHQLLARKLEHEGHDASQVLHSDNVPDRMAAMLLREGMQELRRSNAKANKARPGLPTWCRQPRSVRVGVYVWRCLLRGVHRARKGVGASKCGLHRNLANVRIPHALIKMVQQVARCFHAEGVAALW